MRVEVSIDIHDPDLGEVAGVKRELVVVPDVDENLLPETAKVLDRLVGEASAEATEQVARAQDRASTEA
jgi:hypothetical protein